MKSHVAPKLTKRGRIIYMTDEDAAAFGELLAASFPGIEFAVIRESERVVMRFPSLRGAIAHRLVAKEWGGFQAWIAPRRWRPRWRLEFKGEFYTKYAIENMPSGWFTFPLNHGFRPFNPNAPVPAYTLHPYGEMLMACYD